MASQQAKDILKLLKVKKNVLISGSPGTGKSRILNEVASLFKNSAISSQTTQAQRPQHLPNANIPIPRSIPTAEPELQEVLPAANCSNREVFRTAFHQNTKHREFITGIIPKINGESGFEVIKGTLYRASEFANTENSASLLIIDEINRGPAVQIFGGSLVSIEMDKRLNSNGDSQVTTQYFELICPESFQIVEYALPSNLFILAAMNQADSSVEPMDVAFLRRWFPYKLNINEQVLNSFFNISSSHTVPEQATTVNDVYTVAVRAWKIINHRLALGRGAEFQLGHGIFLTEVSTPYSELDDALTFVAEVWHVILAHIEEVFFGDLRGISAVLNALDSDETCPYHLKDEYFADEPRVILISPKIIDKDNIYNIYRSILA
jgi:5-methylcytosine-specific restriction protein B